MLKLVEEKIGIGKTFLNRTPVAQDIRQMRLYQIKKLLHSK
jgi:hypothetical protein